MLPIYGSKIYVIIVHISTPAVLACCLEKTSVRGESIKTQRRGTHGCMKAARLLSWCDSVSSRLSLIIVIPLVLTQMRVHP